jgi:CRISPR/Cas system-associated exonuclease Cas4 (RecB family)
MKKYLPPRPAAWTGLGIALHETFCEWEKSDRQIDVLEYFEKSFDEYIDNSLKLQPDLDLWQVPPGTKSIKKSIDSYRERGLTKDVPQYLERCLEAEWEIYRFEDGTKAVELEFELDLGDVTIKGGIDRIQWWPELEVATMEDLKSGNVENDETDKRQLGVYAYAARTVFEVPLESGRYWFTKVDRGSEWFDLTRYTEAYLTDLFAKLDQGIKSGIFLPNPGKNCGLCGVQPYCREQGTKRVPSKEYRSDV